MEWLVEQNVKNRSAKNSKNRERDKMAKSFYLASEAAYRLECSEYDLKEHVAGGRLREFRDGGQASYKVEDIEALRDKGQDSTLGLLDEEYPEDLDDTSLGEFAGLMVPIEGKKDKDEVQQIRNATALCVQCVDRARSGMFVALVCSIISIVSMIIVVTVTK